jgi:hypothetical protein
VKELMLEGVCSIVEGMNPKLIRVKLEAFAEGQSGKPAKDSSVRGAARAAAAEG